MPARSRFAAIRRAIDSVPTSQAILVTVAWLCGVGLVMVLAASAFASLATYGSVWAIFERQIIWIAVGCIALVVALRIDPSTWRKYRVVMMLGVLVLLLAVLVPGIGVRAGGSSRWIGFGQLRVQPSELMKFAFAVFGADLVARRSERYRHAKEVVGPLCLVLAGVALLVLIQPDMGTAVVLCCIGLGMLVASGVEMGAILKLLGALGVLAVLVALVDPYRRERLLSFMDPLAHRNGSGYQVVQSLVGLGAGHLTGVGIGAGHQTWGLLPNAQTDFIFSVIGEQTGLLGALLVLASFTVLAWLGLRVAREAPNRFESILAVGITCWLVSQAFINVGAVIGLLPVTGIPLPFVSFGGSALVVEMAGAGVLARIASPHRRSGGRSQRAGRIGTGVHAHRS